MKKFLSVFLAALMLVFCLIPATPEASAVSVHWDSYTYPIVTVGGDGDAIYDAEGNKLIKFKEILSMFSSDTESSTGGAGDAAKNIISALANGIMTDDYTEYYDVFYEEISDMFRELQLDKNGEVSNGSGIGQNRKDEMAYSYTVNVFAKKGYCTSEDYHFWYDWRLDPIEIAQQLHEHIQKVKLATKKDKVILLTRCVGTQVALAYVAQYGTDDLFGIGFDGGTVNGAEPLSETICGKFAVNGNAILRLLDDLEYYGFIDGLDDSIMTTVDMLVKCGVTGIAVDTLKATIYEKIAEGVTSSLARATFFGLPCYWACVTTEDYEDAMNYVFGEEGSEKRVEYAGLIEKIENYHNLVRLHITDLLQEIKDSGINVCVIAKYGSQMVPVCDSMNLVGDQIISAKRASFGATTSEIFGTLSKSYIEQQTQAGLGKYISPDKQIDASTCFFPDNTWFVKGVSHSHWCNFETQLMSTVLSSETKLTVDDIDVGQFVVAIPNYDSEGNVVYNTDNSYISYNRYEKMTEENCNTETWAGEVNPEENAVIETLTGIEAFFAWLPGVMEKLKNFVLMIIDLIKSAVTE